MAEKLYFLPVAECFGGNNVKLDCLSCQFKFASKRDLKQHFRNNHRLLPNMVKNPSFNKMSKRKIKSVNPDSDLDEVGSDDSRPNRKKSIAITISDDDDDDPKERKNSAIINKRKLSKAFIRDDPKRRHSSANTDYSNQRNLSVLDDSDVPKRKKSVGLIIRDDVGRRKSALASDSKISAIDTLLNDGKRSGESSLESGRIRKITEKFPGLIANIGTSEESANDDGRGILTQWDAPPSFVAMERTGKTPARTKSTAIPSKRTTSAEATTTPKRRTKGMNRVRSAKSGCRPAKQAGENKARKPRCTFEGCDFANENAEHLRKHILEVHYGLKEFHCELCDFWSSDERGLMIHGEEHAVAQSNDDDDAEIRIIERGGHADRGQGRNDPQDAEGVEIVFEKDKTEKKSEEHKVLHVFAGKKCKKPFGSRLWTKLALEIVSTTRGHEDAKYEKMEFNELSHGLGFGEMMCENDVAMYYFKYILSKVNIDGHEFKAWGEDDEKVAIKWPKRTKLDNAR